MNYNPISNSAYLGYTFTVDPSVANGATASATTSMVYATISYADLLTTGNFTKRVNREYASKGETVTYTIVANNTGNATATNVILTDIVPSNTTYVTNSLTVNGVTYSGNPNNGITLTSIPPNSTSYITFSALINSIPAINPMVNTASIVYNYTIDPSIPNGGTGTNITNPVYTTIVYADIFSEGNFIKTASTGQAKVLDTLSYTFLVRNTGNTTATNIIVVDTVPYGTRFIPSTVWVNGATHEGTPSTGITLPDIGPGNSAQISFDITIDTITSINPIVDRGYISYKYTQDPDSPLGVNVSTLSSTVITQIVPTITVAKSVSPQYVLAGETVVYTVSISNLNNIKLNNLTLNDMLAPELTFEQNSVTINSMASPYSNIMTGVHIDSLAANSVATIQFQARVASINTGTIPNVANLRYYYPGTNNIQLSAEQTSNRNILNVNLANVSVSKTTPLTTVTMGVTIPYTIVIENTGDLHLYDLIFRDILSQRASFVTSTFKVNGAVVNIDPMTLQRGINVGSLPIGASTTITFDAILKTCYPSGETYKIGNSAYFMYNYVLPDGTGGVKYSPVAATTITKV